MSQMKQKADESADDLAIKMDMETAKAFSPLAEAIKHEAPALSNGLRSQLSGCRFGTWL